MKQFKDTAGREWVLDVTIASIKSVRDLVKVDLWNFFKDESSRILGDPPLMVDVLYVLCKSQCEQRKLSDVDFGQLFHANVLEDAGNALIGAVIDFFPTSRQTILKATVAKSERIASEMTSKALTAIDNLTVTDLLKSTMSAA